MISEHAKHAVNAIFTKAAKANLTVNPEDSIEISQLSDTRLGDVPGKDIVVLTISSSLIPSVSFMRFLANMATCAWVP